MKEVSGGNGDKNGSNTIMLYLEGFILPGLDGWVGKGELGMACQIAKYQMGDEAYLLECPNDPLNTLKPPREIRDGVRQGHALEGAVVEAGLRRAGHERLADAPVGAQRQGARGCPRRSVRSR